MSRSGHRFRYLVVAAAEYSIAKFYNRPVQNRSPSSLGRDRCSISCTEDVAKWNEGEKAIHTTGDKSPGYSTGVRRGARLPRLRPRERRDPDTKYLPHMPCPPVRLNPSRHCYDLPPIIFQTALVLEPFASGHGSPRCMRNRLGALWTGTDSWSNIRLVLPSELVNRLNRWGASGYLREGRVNAADAAG